MWAQAIWGYEKNLPPYDPNDKGHFHVGTAEWWIVLEGQIRHNIETIGRLHVERGRRRLCAAVHLARDAVCRSGAVVPAGDQHVSVHEPARAAAVTRG